MTNGYRLTFVNLENSGPDSYEVFIDGWVTEEGGKADESVVSLALDSS